MQTTTQLIQNSKVESYHLFASNGKPIREATRVILSNGKVFKFLDKLTKREALKSVQEQLSRISFDGKHFEASDLN